MRGLRVGLSSKMATIGLMKEALIVRGSSCWPEVVELGSRNWDKMHTWRGWLSLSTDGVPTTMGEV